MRLLITGGCGFIGSNFVRFVLEHYQQEFVSNVDALTYAGKPGNLAGAHSLRDIPRFVRLIEAGLYNAKALATATFPIERSREAFQVVADRTTVAAIIVPS